MTTRAERRALIVHKITSAPDGKNDKDKKESVIDMTAAYSGPKYDKAETTRLDLGDGDWAEYSTVYTQEAFEEYSKVMAGESVVAGQAFKVAPNSHYRAFLHARLTSWQIGDLPFEAESIGKLAWPMVKYIEQAIEDSDKAYAKTQTGTDNPNV